MNGILMMESLAQIPWSTARRTHGNTEGSIAGLIANWWISLSPKHNEVLEGGFPLERSPSAEGAAPHAKASKGGKGKKKAAAPRSEAPACDLLLCLRGGTVGIVEIESADPITALDRLERVLASGFPELQALRFAMVVLHSYKPIGRGVDRTIPAACNAQTVERATAVSARFPEKNIVLLRLDKRLGEFESGSRSLNELYWGTLDSVEATLFRAGEEQMRRPYDLTPLHVADSVLI